MRQRTRSSCRNTHPGRITIATCRAISSAIAPTGQPESSIAGHIGAALWVQERRPNREPLVPISPDRVGLAAVRNWREGPGAGLLPHVIVSGNWPIKPESIHISSCLPAGNKSKFGSQRRTTMLAIRSGIFLIQGLYEGVNPKSSMNEYSSGKHIIVQ